MVNEIIQDWLYPKFIFLLYPILFGLPLNSWSVHNPKPLNL